MHSDDLKIRSKQFAVRAMRLYKTLPKEALAQILGRQLLRSASSVGANYRAACRARSQADFISRITVVEEEADESQYWIELMIEADVVNANQVKDLHKEAGELTAIFTSSGKTARRNLGATRTKEH